MTLKWFFLKCFALNLVSIQYIYEWIESSLYKVLTWIKLTTNLIMVFIAISFVDNLDTKIFKYNKESLFEYYQVS